MILLTCVSAQAANLPPRCPQCGKSMALRTARSGQRAGQQFWGCTGYPEWKDPAKV
jgi:ssDNA-binding Zn-finger/Zn-ribbon topoisomerase 1